MATKRKKGWWAASAVLAIGLYVECYARSLGDLIMVECPSLAPSAPGHCAHPFWLVLCGLLLIATGVLSLCWLTARAIFKKRPLS